MAGSEIDRCLATGLGAWVDADPDGCDGEEDLDELLEAVEVKEVAESTGPAFRRPQPGAIYMHL